MVTPEGNLLLCGLHRVGAVADVTANLNTEVSSDGAGLAVSRVGLTQHHPPCLDRVESLPDHGHHGAGGHVGHQAGKEGLLGQIGIVLLQVLLGSLHKLHGDQLESLLLEPLDNLADQPAVDAVRLDHDEGALGVGHFANVELGGLL